jgi:hypothetical protein
MLLFVTDTVITDVKNENQRSNLQPCSLNVPYLSLRRAMYDSDQWYGGSLDSVERRAIADDADVRERVEETRAHRQQCLEDNAD